MEKFQSRMPGGFGLILLSVLAAVLSLGLAIYYLHEPILEYHGFRQTQTAITSYWILQEGWRLDYQTPVVGYPWSIPFEFHIYQSLVALLAYLGGFSLEPVGRLVNLVFLFACALPAFQVARRLKLAPEVPWVFSALLWTSPLYLFWGRSFLIDIPAMFFTFAAIPFAIDLFEERPRWRPALLFAFWMSLGILQKVTTALPVLVVMSALVVVTHVRARGLALPAMLKLAQLLVAFVVPVALALWWMDYSQKVRLQNALGLELAEQTVHLWVFGSLQQHLDVGVQKFVLWDRVFARNIAGLLGLVVLGAALAWGERRVRCYLVVSMVLFLLPIEAFLNLHYVHDYYQIASVIFLLAALSIAIVELGHRRGRGLPLVLLLTTAFLASNLYNYKQHYWTRVHTLHTGQNNWANQILEVSDVIQRYTPPDSAIVVFGMDWGSEIAYFSKRKAMTPPDWSGWGVKARWHGIYDEIWRDPIPYLGGLALGAMAFCTDRDNYSGISVSTEAVLKNRYIAQQPGLFKVANCYLWLPGAEEVVLRSGETILPNSSIE